MGIELLLTLFRRTTNFNQWENVVPLAFSVFLHVSKIPPSILSPEIGTGILYGHITDANLVLQRFAVRCIKRKINARILPFCECFTSMQHGLFPCAFLNAICIKLSIEVNLVMGWQTTELPSVSIALARPWRGYHYCCLLNVCASNASANDYRTFRRTFWVDETSHACSLRNCHLCLNAVVYHCLVVACVTFLVADHYLGIAYHIRRSLQLSVDWEHREVSHVLAPGSAGLVDDKSGMFCKIWRCELNHTMRICSTWIQLTWCQTSAYEWVNLVSIVLCTGIQCHYHAKQYNKVFFHTIHLLVETEYGADAVVLLRCLFGWGPIWNDSIPPFHMSS